MTTVKGFFLTAATVTNACVLTAASSSLLTCRFKWDALSLPEWHLGLSGDRVLCPRWKVGGDGALLGSSLPTQELSNEVLCQTSRCRPVDIWALLCKRRSSPETFFPAPFLLSSCNVHPYQQHWYRFICGGVKEAALASFEVRLCSWLLQLQVEVESVHLKL